MNTIGIRQANKNMLMAAVACNLKKYLKFDRKLVTSIAKKAGNHVFEIIEGICRILSSYKQLIISRVNSLLQIRGLLKTHYIESLLNRNRVVQQAQWRAFIAAQSTAHNAKLRYASLYILIKKGATFQLKSIPLIDNI